MEHGRTADFSISEADLGKHILVCGQGENTPEIP